MGINQTKGQAEVAGPSDTDAIAIRKQTPEFWKPDRFNPTLTELNEDARKTILLRRSVTNLLNKLTPENLPTLSEKMKTLPIDTSTRMQQVVEIIHQKAILEWKFRALYAKICEHMRDVKVVDDLGLVKSFLVFLLTHCEMFFHNSLSREFRLGGQKHEMNLCFYQEIQNSLWRDNEEKKLEFRRKSVGNCQFIGELFKVHLIDPGIIFSFLDRLLEKNGNLAVECTCALLETIGLFYEEKIEKLPAMYFEKLESLSSSKDLTPRVRFLIQDVLDLKKNFWRPRKLLELPKTSQQIEQEMMAMSRLDSILKLIKPRSDEENAGISHSFSTNASESKNIRSHNTTETSVPTTKVYSFESSVRDIIEKLTPDNFKQLSNMILKFPINVARLNYIAELLLEQAINKPERCELFAKMCWTLKNVRVSDEKDSTMLETLIRKCQHQFDIHKIFVLEPNRGDFHQKIIFSFRFFGELFNVQVLPSIFILSCVEELLKSPNKMSLECLYELLNVAGKNLISKLIELREEGLDELFDKFKHLLENNFHLSPELKSVLKDLLSMREIEKPVKLSQNVTDGKLLINISAQLCELVSSKNRQIMESAKTIVPSNSFEKTSPSLKKFNDVENPFGVVIQDNCSRNIVGDKENISIGESNDGLVTKQNTPSTRIISPSDSSKIRRDVDVVTSPNQYSVEFCKSLRESPQCEKTVKVPDYILGPLYSDNLARNAYYYVPGNNYMLPAFMNKGQPSVPVTRKNQQDESKKSPYPSFLKLPLKNDAPSRSSLDSQTSAKSASESKSRSDDQRKPQDLYHSVTSILNEITPENVDLLIEKIKNLPINNPIKFRGVIQLIYNKAIDEPRNCQYYAEMIYKLQIPLSEGEDNSQPIDEVDQIIIESKMVELDLKLNALTSDEQSEENICIFSDESSAEIHSKENQVENILSEDLSSTELFEWLKISFKQWTPNGKLPLIDCFEFESTKSQLKSKLHPGIILELIEFVLKNYPEQADKCGQMLVCLIKQGYVRSKAVIRGFEYFLNTAKNHQISAELQIFLNPLFESGVVKPDDLRSVFQSDMNIKPNEIKQKDATISQKKLATMEIAKNTTSILQPLMRSVPGQGTLIPLSSYFDPFFNHTKNTSNFVQNVQNDYVKPVMDKSRPREVKNDLQPSWRDFSAKDAKNEDLQTSWRDFNVQDGKKNHLQTNWRNLNPWNGENNYLKLDIDYWNEPVAKNDYASFRLHPTVNNDCVNFKLDTNHLNAPIAKNYDVKPATKNSGAQSVENDDLKPAKKISGSQKTKTDNLKSSVKDSVAQNVKNDNAKLETSKLSGQNAKINATKSETSVLSAQNAKNMDAKPKLINLNAGKAENNKVKPATKNLDTRTIKSDNVTPTTSYSSVLRKAENDNKLANNPTAQTVKNDDLKPTANKLKVQKANANDVKSGTSNSSVQKAANDVPKPKPNNSSAQTAKNNDVKPKTSEPSVQKAKNDDKKSTASKSKAPTAKNPEVKPTSADKIVQTSKNPDVKATNSSSSQQKAKKNNEKANTSKPDVKKTKNINVKPGTNNSKQNVENSNEKPTIRQLIKSLLKSQTPESFNPLKFTRELKKIRFQKAAELELAASCMIKMVENNPELYEFYIDLCSPMMMLTIENKNYCTMLMNACHSYFHQNILPEEKPRNVFVIVTPEEEMEEEIKKKKLKGFCRFFSLLVNKLDNVSANESVQRIMRKLLDVRKIDYFCEIYESLDPNEDRFEKSLFESNIPKLLSGKELEKGCKDMLKRVADDYKKRVLGEGKILVKKKNQQQHQTNIASNLNATLNFKNLSQNSLVNLSGSSKNNRKKENALDVSNFDDKSSSITRNEINETVVGVLNQLQSHPNSLTELAQKIKSMPIDREPKLIQVILEIYSKATQDDNFGKSYVLLCEHLQDWSIFDKRTGKDVSFKSQMITVIHLKCSQMKFKVGEFEKNGESEKEAHYDLRGKIIEYYRFLFEFLKSPVYGSEILIFPAMELLLLLEIIDEDIIKFLSEFLKILLNDLDLKLANLEYRLRSSQSINIKTSTQELEKYNAMIKTIVYLQKLINFRENEADSRNNPKIRTNRKILFGQYMQSYLRKHPVLMKKVAKSFQTDGGPQDPEILTESTMGALYKSFIDTQSTKEESAKEINDKFIYTALLRIFCEGIASRESHCIKIAFECVKKYNYPAELLPKVLECLYLFEILSYESFVEYEKTFVSNQILEIIKIFNSSIFKKYKLSKNPQEN